MPRFQLNIVYKRLDTDCLEPRPRRNNRRIHFDGSEIEPEDFTIIDGIQADPMNDARVILPEFESSDGWSSIHEVDSAHLSGPKQVKPANPITRDSVQIVLAARQGQADELDLLLVAACQMFTQT